MKTDNIHDATVDLFKKCFDLIPYESIQFRYIKVRDINEYDFDRNTPIKFTTDQDHDHLIIPNCELDVPMAPKNLVLVLDQGTVGTSCLYMIDDFTILYKLYEKLAGKKPTPYVFGIGNFPDEIFRTDNHNLN